ncbi:MAG: hypothetical protein ABEJ93_04205 [Candidatus Nanohalobium sp.]
MESVEVVLDPEARNEHLEELLAMQGIDPGEVEEGEDQAYCPISLTNTPEELKDEVAERQEILKDVLAEAGIDSYDPRTAPYSPDKDLSKHPEEVHRVDNKQIVGARYFTGHNILPSTGFGVELEKAHQYNRIPVILLDEDVRVTRMRPPTVIHLEYSDFEDESHRFVDVFQYLNSYEPGLGLDEGDPVLLGFQDEEADPVNLEQEIYEEFPELRHEYDGETPTIDLKAKNSEILR